MVLLTNGDSWTQGDSPAQQLNWHAEKTLDWYDIIPDFGNPYVPCSKSILYKFYDSEIWPKVLGRNLGATTFNAGRLGDDNYTIARTTINSVEYLLEKGYSDIFVVVGWTSMTREPVFIFKEDKKTFHLTQARPEYQGVEFLYYQSSIYEDKFILLIFMLQEYLIKKELNFLFFNAFDRFDNFEKNTYRHLIDTSKWVHNDVKPGHFKEYILKQNNLKDWYESEYFITSHPRDNAHTQWGNYLTTYIK